MLRAVAMFCIALISVGCTSSSEQNIVLAYGRAARDIGLFPVYPPREEFQIGDVYMWSQSAADPNDTVSVYLDTIDWLRLEADRFMASRIVFDDTAELDKSQPNKSVKDIPGKSRYLTLRGGAPLSLVQSLPIAAFPSVTADAGFTASLGILRVLATLGLAGGTRTTVTLDFNDVRTYFVPNAPIMGKVMGEVIRSNFAYDAGDVDLRRLVELRHGKGVTPCGQGRRCGVSVVTRVYLTRQINYTYRNAQILAAALRVAERGGAANKVPSAPAVNVAINNGTDGKAQTGGLDEQVTELSNRVDALTGSGGTGQAFRFEAWNARGVTFASRYQRPVVVGWDGIEWSMPQGIGGAR